MMRKIPYPHPGEILLEEFLKPLGITQYRLAKEIGVPQRRIGEIVAGKRTVTADTGLRLSRYFSVSEGFWIGLQADYDAAMAKESLSKILSAIAPLPRPDLWERLNSAYGGAAKGFDPRPQRAGKRIRHASRN